ncbi:hypothetical protein [Sandaracinobacteroides hominis]|uniref:hypothetical protein n=1 Tax=Sandaracinobacteroides hominis TaxID=2780086 RepID=UPI0018F5FF79|nr:hypothetical protein [Sandaracinobacteroides hominis]
MSFGLHRSLADLACRLLQAALPSSLQSWGWAVRCETADIPDDTKALLFALDSLCGLLPRAVAARLLQPFVSRGGDGAHFSGGSIPMTLYDAIVRRPRALGIACAIVAVGLGLAYMAIARAPMRYLAINVAALAIGLTMLALLGRTALAARQWTGGAIVVMAGALLATALLGSRVEGAARWVNLGGLAIQPSLILLPVMLMAFAQTRGRVATAGILVAAAAMALQPDRAMAGMLVLGLAALAIVRPDRHVLVALAAAVTGFAATLVRADTLPAVPYVDQIFYSSFDVHAVAGMAVLGGTGLLLVPAVVGWSRDAENRATYAVFGAVWFTVIAAAALGNYPTPMVGYGSSAIIGYALSLLALPKPASAPTATAPETDSELDRTQNDRHLLAGLGV